MWLLQKALLFTDSVLDLKRHAYDTGGQRLMNWAIYPISSWYSDKLPEYALYFQIAE